MACISLDLDFENDRVYVNNQVILKNSDCINADNQNNVTDCKSLATTTVDKKLLIKLGHRGYSYMKPQDINILNKDMLIYYVNRRTNNKSPLMEFINININNRILWIKPVRSGAIRSIFIEDYYIFYKIREQKGCSTRMMMEHLLEGLENGSVTFTYRK